MHSTIPKKCEVLVIGGGPAGSMAAAFLSQSGIEVVLLEKEDFPRHVIGESLIPHFWKLMDLIGLSDRIMEAGFVKKAGGGTLWNQKFRKMSFHDFGYKRPGLHVERPEFDKIVLNRAKELGTSVFHQIKVEKVKLGEELSVACYKNQITNEKGEISASFVIDASGQGALIARQENIRKYDDAFRFNAFWAYYEGGRYVDGDVQIRNFGEHFKYRPLSLVSSIGEWGWVWQLLLKETISMGIILPKSKRGEFKNRGSSLGERFQNVLDETPLAGELMKGAVQIPGSLGSIKDYAYSPTRLTVGNCYLAGDSAAFVDPISSAGIVLALYQGFFAAWCIRKSVNEPHRTAMFKQLYEEQLKMRLDLFRLLSYPAEFLTDDMINNGKKLIERLSDEEIYLALTHLTMVHRADNLKDLFKIPLTELYQEIPESEIRFPVSK